MTAKRANGDARPYYDQAKGRWCVAIDLSRGPDGQRRRRKITGTTAADARRNARDVRAKLDQGEPIPDRTRTVATFLGWWLAEVIPGTVSDSTEVAYGNAARHWIVPRIGAVRLVDLSSAHVTGMLRSMEAEGYAANTRSLARRVLARALRRAEQEGWVVRNVARIVDGPGARPERPARCLTPDEGRTLLAAAAGDRYQVPMTLQLALGLRRGELLGLAWPDLDLDATPATLTVRRQLQRRPGRGLVLDRLKTVKSARTLALPAPVAELLRSHRVSQAKDRLLLGSAWTGTDELVFTTPLGTPVDPDNYRHQVGRLAEAAGLGHIGTHVLRHSAGSFLFALGLPMRTISELLGHATTRVTEDVYVHVQAAARAEAAEATSQALWG